MRKVAFWIALVVAMVFAAGTGFAAAPDKPLVMKAAKAKGPVTFDHAKHAKECATCHHKDAAGKEQTCFACHKAEKKDAAVALKDAMHTKCQGCHKKDTTKKAPTKCDGCHKK